MEHTVPFPLWRYQISYRPDAFFLLPIPSPHPAPRERDCSGERRCLLSSLDQSKVELTTEEPGLKLDQGLLVETSYNFEGESRTSPDMCV